MKIQEIVLHYKCVETLENERPRAAPTQTLSTGTVHLVTLTSRWGTHARAPHNGENSKNVPTIRSIEYLLSQKMQMMSPQVPQMQLATPRRGV